MQAMPHLCCTVHHTCLLSCVPCACPLLLLPWSDTIPACPVLPSHTCSTSLSILLAMMFFVSHNVPENKPLPGGAQDTKKVRAAGAHACVVGVVKQVAVCVEADWTQDGQHVCENAARKAQVRRHIDAEADRTCCCFCCCLRCC